MTIERWVELYNNAVDEPIKRFSSRADALKRCTALAAERKWYYRPFTALKRRIVPTTRRGQIVEALRGGATMEQLRGIVAAQDQLKSKEPVNLDKRVWTILHAVPTYNGFGILQIGEVFVLLEE